MADNERPEGEDKTLEAGASQQDKGQNPQTQGQIMAAGWTPPAPPYGAWQPPSPPDVFREYGGGGAWPPQQPPMAVPPVYPGQPPVQSIPPGAPGAGFWPPTGAPPPFNQDRLPGVPTFPPNVVSGVPQPNQSSGFVTTQPPPPAKTSPALLAMLGGMVLLVILVPLLLFLLTRAPSTASTNPQATSTPKTSVPTATPAGSSSFFTPAGTAPTSKQCVARLGLPCYSPEQIQKAYNLDSLYRQGYDGKGQTIVILGTGNTPNIESDLKAFDKAWGLPDPPSFQILQPFGPPVPYTCSGGEDGLQIETTLDVEWSHAIAPGANIVVVIGSNTERMYLPPPAGATNCSFYDLEQDVAYALDHHLGNIISISYGGSELGAKTDTATDKANEQKELSAADSIFKRAASMGVTVMASTGDTGATNGDSNSDPSQLWNKPNISWPASDPYVLAVGGTTLTLKDDSGTYGNEVVWNDPATGGAGGGGISAIYDEPAYQKTVANQAMFQGKRGIPDVAFPADVNYSLYVTLSPGDVDAARFPHWTLIGGTSASSPCWAGIIAIADQMSVQMDGQPLGFIHPALYSLQGKGLHDIIQGDNSFSGVQGYPAQQGYDLASGWGTPIADQFIPALVQAVQQVGNTP
jgi:subtilase family serine protease